jgi:hypothetical protein
VGPQQQYLESIEGRMLQEGADYRLKHRLPNPMSADEVRTLPFIHLNKRYLVVCGV